MALSVKQPIASAFALIVAGICMPLSAQETGEVPNWNLRSTPTDCVIVYENAADDTFFSYQLRSDGKHIIGLSLPGWNSDLQTPEQLNSRPVVTFGENSVVVDGVVDPLVGRSLERGETLQSSNFLLFNDFEHFTIQRGQYQAKIATSGVARIRSEFDKCLKGLVEAPVPPRLELAKLDDKVWEAVQAALLVRGGKELVIAVDAEGNPSSCRSIPVAHENAIMLRACRLLMRERYSPATDADGNPVAGEYVAFSQN